MPGAPLDPLPCPGDHLGSWWRAPGRREGESPWFRDAATGLALRVQERVTGATLAYVPGRDGAPGWWVGVRLLSIGEYTSLPGDAVPAPASDADLDAPAVNLTGAEARALASRFGWELPMRETQAWALGGGDPGSPESRFGLEVPVLRIRERCRLDPEEPSEDLGLRVWVRAPPPG